jgi:drug/metabolite transporter (DMT)-like permease
MYFILNEKQSGMQMFALLLLLFGAVLLNMKSSIQPVPTPEISQSFELFSNYNFGLLCCLSASSLSGLSGTLAQKALIGPNPQHAYVYTAELAFYGSLFLCIAGLFRDSDREALLRGELFKSWEYQTLIPVVVNVSSTIRYLLD